MKLSKILFIYLFLSLANSAIAQDVITLKDSIRIKCLIEKSTSKTIFYITSERPSHKKISRRKIERINYGDSIVVQINNKNRSVENLNNTATYKSKTHRIIREIFNHKMLCGKNVVSVAIQGSDASLGNRNMQFPGFGVQYERFLDRKNRFSLYLPATVSFYSIYYQRNEAPNYSADFYTKEGTYNFYYFYPGIKYYPWTSNRRFACNVGASFVVGFGQKYHASLLYDSITRTTSTYSIENKPVIKTGILLSNCINYMATKHIRIGVELGAGLSFENNDYKNDYINFTPARKIDDPFPDKNIFLFQFNFKIGYRF